ncbi:FMN-binding protein [Alkalibaculum sp. M08DMB]|uniref:FMN-binding protein n=1 Tax=Alkalibaculum sporogenes TaxID=2655001 RepID=A0A6A7K4T4_9FIRM|nr:FMN-binding protein [Alkalibaculum sporogenes]
MSRDSRREENVDTISGATMTSTAIIIAVEDALNKSN